MGVQLIKNNFTHGLIDERMNARVDLDIYNKSCLTLTNAIPVPQGGIKRRFGLEYITQLNSTYDETKLEILNFGDGVKYLCVFQEKTVVIYQNDVAIANVTTPYLASEINKLRFTQSHRTLIIFHPDHAPAELYLDGATWKITTPPIDLPPAVDYTHDYNSYAFSVKFTDASAPIGVSQNVINYETAITCDNSFFTSDYVDGVFKAYGGAVRLVTFVNSTRMQGKIENVFDEKPAGLTLVIAPEDMAGKFTFVGEKAFSDARGWPRTGTFYQDRLIFGGTDNIPYRVWFSVTNGYFFNDLNFQDTLGTEDQGFSLNVMSNSTSSIKYIISYNGVVIFTEDSIYATPSDQETGISFKNISLKKIISTGCSDVQPIEVDGKIIYVRGHGQAVHSLTYDYSTGFQDSNISLVAASYIDEPIASAKFVEDDELSADYVFFVDGINLLIYQTINDQNISNWSFHQTDNGLFRDVVASDDLCYFIVERTINGFVKTYLEKVNFDMLMDSATTFSYGSPTTIVTGLGHLEGETVSVRADGYILDTKTVSGGSITLERASLEVEVGIGFDVTIKPNYPQFQTEMGSSKYQAKRVVRAYIDYYESGIIYVNNILIPPHEFSVPLDSPRLPESGIYEFLNMNDWAPDQDIEITQPKEKPSELYLRAVGYEIEV